MRGATVVARDVSWNVSPGDTLRAALMVNAQGRAETLILALGKGRGRDWQPDPAAGGLEVPAEALPCLIRALEGLIRAAEVLEDSDLSINPES